MVSFRFLFVSVVMVMAVLAASVNVLAVEKVVKIDSISAVQGTDTVVVVNLKSGKKLTDSKLTVSIPELGLRAASHTVDFSKSNKQTVDLVIPDSALEDQYVRVVFSSDQGHRVRYLQVDAQ